MKPNMTRYNCNLNGAYIHNIIQGCFRPDVDVYVYRDASPEEEVIYSGKASDVPNLRNYWVVDIDYDWYNCIFFIEVK